jgi:hypothetical protein
MSKKKDTEIQIVDTKKGVDLMVGKRVVAQILETGQGFEVVVDGKLETTLPAFPLALEEAIKAYNLSI